MCSYVLSLARYDASYDVRDRARLLRKFVEPSGSSVLASHATYIFYRGQFTLGSLSQYVGAAAAGRTRTSTRSRAASRSPVPPHHRQGPPTLRNLLMTGVTQSRNRRVGVRQRMTPTRKRAR
ncbi:unnamed protein product [Leptidea sinapis]|uniref:Uncharacterized protein n=1 Tax=Leptidea sinapis TaxID=189913 RepID=A0A5E4Q2D8_9NEOP|nr:unnamed protein product [Leptidea sinapis]